jgi:hypothetical protein
MKTVGDIFSKLFSNKSNIGKKSIPKTKNLHNKKDIFCDQFKYQ